MGRNISIDISNIKAFALCTKLVADIIKHVLCQRRQIPFPYDYLRSLATSHSLDSMLEDVSPQMLKKAQQKERMVEVYRSFEEIFEALNKQLLNGGPNHVQEVALILGTNINCPKEIYLLKLTSEYWVDARDYCQFKTNMYMRDVAMNQELQVLFDKPLSPNNIHVLIKLPVQHGGESVFPREDYEIPLFAPCVTFRLNGCSVEHWHENCKEEPSVSVTCRSTLIHRSTFTCNLKSTFKPTTSQATSSPALSSRISSEVSVCKSSKSGVVHTTKPSRGTLDRPRISQNIISDVKECGINLKAVKFWWCQVGRSIEAFKYKLK